MKRIVWLGAAALIALAAVIPLWLVLDDGGERRAAALTEPAGSNRPRLTIPDVNSGKPFGVQSFSWGAERKANGVLLHDLEFTLDLAEISPQLFDVAAPSAKLELYKTDSSTGNVVLFLTYEFREVAIHTYEDGGDIKGVLAKSGSKVAAPSTTARMTFASVGERFASTPAVGPVHLGSMTVSTVEGKGVPIRDYQFSFEKGPEGATVADKLMVTREIDRLAPWFSAAVIDGTPADTSVTIDLVRTNENTTQLETFATYELSNVTVESVRHFDSFAGEETDPPVQEVELSFASVQLTSGGKTATLGAPK